MHTILIHTHTRTQWLEKKTIVKILIMIVIISSDRTPQSGAAGRRKDLEALSLP